MEDRFMIGQIVEWGCSLWIIAEVHRNDDGLKGLELIDLNHSNCSAFPTKVWPSEERGIAAVKIISYCMKDFFKEKIENLFSWPKEGPLLGDGDVYLWQQEEEYQKLQKS